MTLKSRLVGLVVILALLTMTPSLFAQIQISIIPEPSTGDIQTNHNALASVNGKNDGIIVIGSLLAISDLSTATLQLTFPAPITSIPSGSFAFSSFNAISGPPFNCTTGGIKPSSTSGVNPVFLCETGAQAGLPSGDPIRISATGGVFSAVSAVLLNTTANRLEIPLPKVSSNSQSGSFTVSGTRIDVNGLTGAQTVTASINDSTTGYLIGSPNSGTIISTLAPGIAASGLAVGLAPGNTTIGGVSGNPGAGTATIFTNGSISRSLGSFIITEGCAACWRTATQSSQGNNGAGTDMNSTQIRLTFNNIPTGVSLNLTLNTGNSTNNSSLNPAWGADSAGGTAGTTGTTTTVTSAANTAVISFIANANATGTSTSRTETLEVDVAIAPLASGAAITTPGSISVTGTMFPVGTGRDSSGLGLGTDVGGYPQFNETDVGPLTVVNIVPASTTMLVTLAEVVPPFDTGISIANTTADPFTPGGGGATPKAGTIVFNFFPNNSTGTGAGTPFSLTTSSTATFNGMSSDGTLAPGATLAVLLSQLLAAAGHPGTFTGYIFIQTNFTNAHGVGTITDFKTFSLATNVLVLPPPTTAGRAGNGVESLGF
jgi:hypothetical protein